MHSIRVAPKKSPCRRLARPALLALLLLPLPLSPAAAAPAEMPAGSDAQAQKVAARLMDALGGATAWQNTRFVEFDFLGRRKHVWDKQTGRHRLEGESREGQKFVVLSNIGDKGEGDGQVFLDGEAQTGDVQREWLKNAYAAWVNDVYWLAMPYKLHDPGVHLGYKGTEEIDGKTYDVLHLSFDHVGLTPGDEYWAYINRDTGLMDRWAYHLESMGADDPPTAWDWVGWKRYGKVELSPTRKQVGGDHELSLAPISVPDSVPDSVFEQP